MKNIIKRYEAACPDSLKDNANDLIPDWLAAMIPRDTSTVPAKEHIVYVRIFTPDSSWTWYVVEYNPESRIAFGFAINWSMPEFAEWGSFSIAELESVRGGLGLHPERDFWFTPSLFPEVVKQDNLPY